MPPTVTIIADYTPKHRVSIPVIFILFGFGFTAIYNPSVISVMVSAISDAYLQVSTFVAGTLFIFFSIEKIFKIDLSEALSRSGKWQVPLAACLGALPGCGGAIIVVTKYVTGRLSFGSVLATLTATMGDAAFLLLAKEPLTGLLIICLGFIVGVLTGYIVDAIHGRDFMRPKTSDPNKSPHQDQETSGLLSPFLDNLWLVIFAPGLLLGILLAFQIDVDSHLAFIGIDAPATLLGFVGGMLCFFMWGLPRIFPQLPRSSVIDSSIVKRTIADTNFVTSWVIFAFLLFEVFIHLTGLDLKNMFSSVATITPLIAVLIGFLPGCGPQIIVTTLYLGGYVPLSAQIGNAISNDGDALFPAIALAPGAAMMATLYSSIPALFLAYGWYFFIQT